MHTRRFATLALGGTALAAALTLTGAAPATAAPDPGACLAHMESVGLTPSSLGHEQARRACERGADPESWACVPRMVAAVEMHWHTGGDEVAFEDITEACDLAAG